MRRHFRIACLPVLLACVVSSSGPLSFAQQSAPTQNAVEQDKELCTIAGNVVRSGTSEPLTKARVALRSEDDRSTPPYVTVTDSEGRFAINEIRPGRYALSVERNGYQGKSYGEDDHGNSFTILTLKPAQHITDIVFRLQGCAVISGRILDEDGEPAEGITVELLAQNNSHGKVDTFMADEGQTNDLGEYRLFDLRPGRYFLRAYPSANSWGIVARSVSEGSTLKSAGGYAPTYFPKAMELSRASAIEVKAGEEASGIDLMLVRQRTYKIRGRVFNSFAEHSGGNTIVGAAPEDSVTSSLADLRRGSVNESTGDFEINDVPIGRYTVYAHWQEGENDLEGSLPIEVPNANVDSIRIVINRGADVRGRVVLAGKAAPNHLSVTVESRSSPQISRRRQSWLKADKTFLLSGLSDGVYDFDVWSECEGCYLKSATANGQDILDRGLQISSGTYASPIELVYSSSTATVDGTVVREDGSTVSGAEVILVADSPQSGSRLHSREIPTDQYGHFTIRGIAPGNYHAYSWQSTDFDYTDREVLKPFEQSAQTLSIGENEKKSLRLSVLPAPDARQ